MQIVICIRAPAACSGYEAIAWHAQPFTHTCPRVHAGLLMCPEDTCLRVGVTHGCVVPCQRRHMVLILTRFTAGHGQANTVHVLAVQWRGGAGGGMGGGSHACAVPHAPIQPPARCA